MKGTETSHRRKSKPSKAFWKSDFLTCKTLIQLQDQSDSSKSHQLTKSSQTAAISQGHTVFRDSPGVYIPLLPGLPHAHRCARKHTHTMSNAKTSSRVSLSLITVT